MEISLPLALSLIGFVFLVAAGLLLMTWAQRRELAPLGLWGLAFGLAAIGSALVAGRGHIADAWSIVIADVLIAAAYAAMWSGARLFGGRPLLPWAASVGIVLALVATLSPGIGTDASLRAMVMVGIGIAYTLATAAEIYRSRRDDLPSRWPAVLLLLVHAAALPTRVPLVGAVFGMHRSASTLLAFVTFESMLLAVAGAYLFGGLVREQMASAFRRAAMADPLTGVANRRAFLEQGTRLIQRAETEQSDVCLLLFDIDHFKAINDAHGHAAGDAVLTMFCCLAKAQLRPSDLFARIGGEEFSALLVDVDAARAGRIAERVRFAFEGAVHSSGGEQFGATVSAGVAAAKARHADLPALLIIADRALYRAKQSGRNRIEQEMAAPGGPSALVFKRA